MIPFVAARNYTPGPRTHGPILWLVVHDMEALETPNTAEGCAAYFANQPASVNGSGSSAHYCIDEDSIVQSVRDSDIAWAAPGANAQGLHFELAGFANQTRAEWLDEYGFRLLEQAAGIFAEKAAEYGVPVVWLLSADVRAGRSGIVTHRTITEAMRTPGGHTDPGPEFPADVFMGLVARKSKPVPAEEDDDVAVQYVVREFGDGRMVKVRPVDGGRKLAAVLGGAWLVGDQPVTPAAISSGFGTVTLDVARAIGKPALNGEVFHGQDHANPARITVSDADGDYTFTVA